MGNKQSSNNTNINTVYSSNSNVNKTNIYCSENNTYVQVDEKTQYLVNGFIHHIENEFKLSTNIPIPIIELCILFFVTPEFFEIKDERVCIDISGNHKDIITKTRSCWRSVVYGSCWFQSNQANIIKWTFKMLYGGSDGVMIGIVSKELDNDIVDNKANVWEYHDNQPDGKDNQPPYYFFGWTSVYHNRKVIKSGYGKTYGAPGSILIMELNLKKGQLIYYDGNQSKCYGVAANIKQDKTIKYKLAISLFYQNAKLKLMKFECN